MRERDFDADVSDDRNREAEELVGRWLRETYDAEVIDARDRNAAYDWEVRWGTNVDVKTSNRLDKEDRVHYEFEHVYGDGRRKPGWSVGENPKFVIYVNRRTFQAHLICMAEWRAHVQDRLWHAEEHGLDKPDGWIFSNARSRRGGARWQTLAWSIPLDELREAGLVWKSWDLRGEQAA